MSHKQLEIASKKPVKQCGVNFMSNYFHKDSNEKLKNNSGNEKINESAIISSSASSSDVDFLLEINSPSTSTAAVNRTSGVSATNLYHGKKLDLDWLLKSYPFLEKSIQIQNNRNHIFATCTMCKKFFDDASKVAKNGTIPIVTGVRADCAEKLKRIIDHLDSAVHKAAEDAKKSAELWEQQSDKHPWVKVLKSHRAGVVNDLISLYVDVYNDSLLETPSARTWPARSLASLRTKSIQS